MLSERCSMVFLIREIKEIEYPILSDFLYEAIFVPEGETPPDRSILRIPELQVYIADFGRKKDDVALVAESDHHIVGAVWSRIMNDYGHVDDETPSLAVSVYEEYRGQGIGTQLMNRMLELLKGRGYKRVSLSVQKANDAVRLYERMNFKTVNEKGEEYIMACRL